VVPSDGARNKLANNVSFENRSDSAAGSEVSSSWEKEVRSDMAFLLGLDPQAAIADPGRNAIFLIGC
jgi:di/tripeptidase